MKMMTKMTMIENSREHIAGTGGMRLEYTRELSIPKRQNPLVKILKMESLFGGYATPAEQVSEVKPESILKQGYLDK